MKTIIIVDDDLDVLDGMRDSVPWDELKIKWVGEAIDGRKGLQVVRELLPDIVITDINMPFMNGLEMIEILKEEGFKGKFILLSGYADFEYARQAIRLNVDDYLTKPITLESLGKVLISVTDRLEHDDVVQMEYITLKDQINKYKPYLINEWMKSVVTNQYYDTSGEIPEIKDILSKWSRQYHFVFAIEMVGNGYWETLVTNRNLLHFAIQNITCEMLRNELPDFDYLVLHSHRIAVLIHAEPLRLPPEDVPAIASRIQQHLYTYLTEHLKVNLKIATSAVFNQWQMVGEAYNALFDPSFASNGESNSPLRSVKFYHDFSMALRKSNENEALRVISEYMDKHDAQIHFSQKGLYSWAEEVWASIVYSMYNIGIELEFNIPQNYVEEHLKNTHTPSDLRNWLERIVFDFIHNQQRGENIKHRQIIDYIVCFVHDHYAENITLGLLSDELQISQNYLGQIFRNITKDTFNQYVTKVRMEKAKQFILEGRHYIYEIADKVGYSNIPYFSKQFKKYIGLNPADLIKK